MTATPSSSQPGDVSPAVVARPARRPSLAHRPAPPRARSRGLASHGGVAPRSPGATRRPRRASPCSRLRAFAWSGKPVGALALALLVAIAALGAGAAHAETARPALRLQVIAQEASVHTGPGPTYREVYYARRGQLFPVRERSTLGYWYRVELDDGTTGWIYGAFVVPVEDAAEPPPGFFGRLWGGVKDTLLGPAAVVGADIEVSFSAGVLGAEGLYLVRPAWLIDEYFAVEGFFGLNARAQQDVFLGGLGWTLRMMPGATLGPYVHAGVGAAYVRPKVDNFADPEELLMALSAGGGFELTLKKQITLRLDFRNWTLFDPNQSSNAQEYTSGLAIFF